MPAQPQQQQQSSSEEGSKENTILNGPRHQKERSAQGHPSGSADSMPQGPAPTAPTHTPQTGGPPQAPQSTIRKEITRIHQNAMEPPVDPPKHLQMAKAQDPLKERRRCLNLTLEHHQVQVLLHNLLDHLKTQLYVQHVAKVAIGAEIALTTIFVMFVGLPLTLHTCAELLSMETQQQDHQSVYIVVKLIMDQLIVGSD